MDVVIRSGDIGIAPKSNWAILAARARPSSSIRANVSWLSPWRRKPSGRRPQPARRSLCRDLGRRR